MRKSEIADLISMARAFDDRIEEVATPVPDPQVPGRVIEDARLAAWHLILGDVDYELACRGLAELYQEPQMMRLQPGHVYAAAMKVRRRNLGRLELSQLVPPDEIAAGEGSRYPQWLQAAVDAVGRGATVEQAQTYADDQLGVSRRLLGPAVKRDLRELTEGAA